ncbi:MAG TPA: hypothetical protein VL154_16210 [Acetobacteraceae bacterium]|nr:hypothetical protein [Acetobacteraceae bacterium]
MSGRGLTPAAEAAVQQEIVARTVAVELDFVSAPVRVNGSPNSIMIGADEFVGVGGLGSIATAEEATELKAYSLNLSLSGIPRDAVATAMTEAYQSRRATIWEVLLDPASGHVIDDPVVVFRGRMSQMNVTLGETATVEVVLENRLTAWDRPRLRRYTDADQQREHPGDLALQFVDATTDQEITWPARSFFG